MRHKNILICPKSAKPCFRADDKCEEGRTCARDGNPPIRGDFESISPAVESDAVNHPKHYNNHPSGIECINVVEHFGFNLGNVIKYLWRAEEKGALIEDLLKANWYLEREIEERKREQRVLTEYDVSEGR